MRVSTAAQTTDAQKLIILQYCQSHNLKVNNYIEVTGSTQKSEKDRKIPELKAALQAHDTVIVSELSRLGRSVIQVAGLIRDLTDQSINMIMVKQNLVIKNGKPDPITKAIISIFSAVAELEADLLRERVTAGLEAAKERGVVGGREKGSIYPSKLDGREADIQNMLFHKVSLAAMARMLGCGKSTLVHFIRTRKLESVSLQQQQARQVITT